MKDLNGKEIRVGDTLRGLFSYEPYERLICVIRYKNIDVETYTVYDGNKFQNLPNSNSMGVLDVTDESFFKDYEIIGRAVRFGE